MKDYESLTCLEIKEIVPQNNDELIQLIGDLLDKHSNSEERLK
jgi:hypothetical protein